MISRFELYRATARLVSALCACSALAASNATPLLGQTATTTAPPPLALVSPGEAQLQPLRVSDRVDTLSLLVTAPRTGERSYATLVRRITRANDGGFPVLRETQHYEFASGTKLDDTLDVSASSLAPLRYFSADHQGVFDLTVQGTHIDGWRTDSLGVRTDVHATTTRPFFVSIMTEGFIAAFPLDMGASINIPVADPPVPAVRAVTLRATGLDTLQTAQGAVRCILVVGPGNTETWIAQDDHRLVRMHWTLPNGTSVWKLPARDAPLRKVNEQPGRGI